MDNRCVYISRLSVALALALGAGMSSRLALAAPVSALDTEKTDGGALVLGAVDIEATQDSAVPADSGVVITQSAVGTKTGAALTEVPQAISVVGRTQMDQQKAQTVAQALKYTPGVFADSRADGLFDGLWIRGFGGFGGLANFNKLLDGLPMQSGQYLATPAVDAYLLDQVEVLKGPASVLYGQASPGGVVNLVSKRPTDTPLHEIELQTGSRGERQIATDQGGALDADGVWSYRLTALSRRADTQIDHTEEQRIAIAPSLTWRPDDDTSLTLLSSYQHDPSSYYTGWVPATGSALGGLPRISRSYNPGEPSVDAYDREQTMFGYQFEHRFNDIWTFRQNARYMDLNSEYKGFMVNYVNPFSTTAGELNRLADHSIEKQQTFNLDNQLQASFDTGALQHTLLMGLEYDQGKSSMRFGRSYSVTGISYLNPVYDANAAAQLPALTSHTVQKPVQTGLYLQDQIKLDRWTFLAGLRQDWARSRTEDRVADSHSSQKDQDLTGRLGVVYAFDNGLSPYASYSTSFEPVVGTDAQGQAFKPTKGEQYEVGIKYQPPGWDSFVTLSAYQIKQKDVRTADPDNALYYVQTGEVRVRGAELEGRANLTEQLSVLAGYSVLDPEVTRDTTASNVGNRPVSVPLSQASLWVDYALRGGFEGMSIGAGVRHIGKSYGDTANDFSVDPYTLIDAAVRYDLQKAAPALKGWSVAINVNNLNDKHYVASCFSAGGCFYGPERTTLASLKYSW